MFAFDHWAGWLQARASDLALQGIDCAFKDGRLTPELASNPSYVLEVKTKERIGYIGFWSNGLCDIEVLDIHTDTWPESASMLEASDTSVPALFERFSSALQLGRSQD